jgi:hypothetical protein
VIVNCHSQHHVSPLGDGVTDSHLQMVGSSMPSMTHDHPDSVGPPSSRSTKPLAKPSARVKASAFVGLVCAEGLKSGVGGNSLASPVAF